MNFIDLINTYKIEIPILQRDYVQGRLNDKVNDIRKNFVNDLVEHISTSTDKILPLDFIYGFTDEAESKYDRELSRSNIDNLIKSINDYSVKINFEVNYNIVDTNFGGKDLFIPLDGQQRLTTLFLLHLYVASQYNTQLVQAWIGRFAYKTRKSSTKFCHDLVQNIHSFFNKEEISEKIQDSIWFYSNWKKDPTVEGMLVMLNEIEERFKLYGSDRSACMKKAYENLFEDPKIVFDFLDINQAGLSDELYLKMNSTGKPLTDYDNFKAWFVGEVERLQVADQDTANFLSTLDWKNLLDQQWYNVFWDYDATHADDNLYAFIKSILSYELVLNSEQITEKVLFEKLNSSEFVSNNIFIEKQLINFENIKTVFTILNFLISPDRTREQIIDQVWNSTFHNGKNFRNSLLTDLPSLSLLHKNYIFFTIRMLADFPSLRNETFYQWLRIFRNINYNTRIDDYPRFKNLLSVTDGLLRKQQLIVDLSITNQNFGSFDGKQVAEEKNKLPLHLDPVWSEHLANAENHHYFYGQVLFLLKWSQIDSVNNLDRFCFYLRRVSNFFSEPHLSSINHILQRVLLTKFGDMWMPEKTAPRFSFCKNVYKIARDRDENWRLVLGSENNFIKYLLDDCDGSTIELEKLIQDGKDKRTDYCRYFIEDPQLISKCGERLINRLNNGDFVRMLDKTKTSGYHTELRSWVLYNILKDQEMNTNVEVKYHYVNSNDRDCRIELVGRSQCISFSRGSRTFIFKSENIDEDIFTEIELHELDSAIIPFIRNFIYHKVESSSYHLEEIDVL
jgi:hypothetical protein